MRCITKKPSVAQKKAIEDEIRRQISENIARLSQNIEALVLWQLHEQLGFGRKRLLRFHREFMPELKKMQEWYEMPTGEDAQFLCTIKLEEIGIDMSRLESPFTLTPRLWENGNERKH